VGQPSCQLARRRQASAAFPGGFPPRVSQPDQRIYRSAAQLQVASETSNRDGTDEAVYTTTWRAVGNGLCREGQLWSNLGAGRTAPNQLVVVNASARIPWIPFRMRLIPLVGELAALLLVIMYVHSTDQCAQAGDCGQL